MPALDAIRRHGLGAVLAAAGTMSGSSATDSSATVTRVLLHHPGSRCTLLASLQGKGSDVVVKMMRRDIERFVALDRLLLAAGLSTGTAPTAPPLLGYDRDLRLLVTPFLTGRTVDDLVSTGDGSRAGALAAEWLWCAAGVVVDGAELSPEPDVVSGMRRRIAKLAVVDAAFGRRATRVADLLERSRPATRPDSLCHGAFRPMHIFDIGGPAVIDWDGAHRGHLAGDAGMFVAALRKPPRTPRPRAGVDDAVRSFRAAISGLVPGRDVDWYEAVATLKLAGYAARKGRENWRNGVNIQLSTALELANAA